MPQYVLLNGEVVAADEARISVWDGGFLHGAGLFETIRAEHGRLFRLEQHVARLRRSAETLLSPIDRARLPSANDFARLLEMNELTSARVRLTVTAGSMSPASETQQAALTVCATAAPLSGYPDEMYRTGIAVVISRYRQSRSDPLAGHKCTSYLPRLLALRHAHAAHCMEALWFTPEHLLAEGSISNVFVIKAGRLTTPPLDTPVLPGIAREVTMECAKEAGMVVEERAVNIDDLLDADEVFLTNSMMRIMPVIRIERRDIGAGKPGETTRKLLERYHQTVERECQSP
ncbi:MAG TPA: aminotransferase class IV [Phycisphaerae bacterium]|jgi:branched-chain amino acid aminotransferase